MKPMKKLSALLITLTFAGLSGCGSSSEDSFLSSIQQGLIHQTAYYGAQNGMPYGPVNSSQTFPVIKVDGWEDASYIYGMKIKCSNGKSQMYGPAAPHGTQMTLNVPAGKWINKIEASVDGSNVLRGIRMYTNDAGIAPKTWGDMSFTFYTVFDTSSGANVKFTDMIGYEDQLTHLTFVSNSFYYTTN